MAEPSPQSRKILHERQRLQLCLLHALNNLYQGTTTFTRNELNTMARNLLTELHDHEGPFSRMFNPHYNILTGNYDANVLMRVLQTRGAEISFCDPRMGADPINLDDPKLIGFIFNHRVEKFGWKGRHWAALKKIENIWFDLDSYLTEPEQVGNNDNVREFISQMFARGSEVIRVLKLPE